MINTMDAPKILIVEDDDSQGYVLRVKLQKLGFKLTGIALNEATFHQLFAMERPDIILCDINIIGTKGGLDLIEELHQSQIVPVIFISSTAEDDKIYRAKNMDFCKFMEKPLDFDDLFIEIYDSLSKYMLV